MTHGRTAARRHLNLEMLEDRRLPSGGSAHPFSRSAPDRAHQPRPNVFVAYLSPDQVVLPQDQGNPAESPSLSGPSQIQGGGGAALFPTPLPGDPARGTIKFTITDGGKEIAVTGSLARISNISAVTLHDTNFSSAFALRGSTTSPATQPPALQPNQRATSGTPNSTVFYSANTINSAQTTETGQIRSSNFDQTVFLLLNPGNGSGPVPPGATFQTVIKAQYLEGPLAVPGGFSKLIKDMRAGYLYVLVQTNNGYDPATGAQQDGNYPNGELRGMVVAPKSHAKAASNHG